MTSLDSNKVILGLSGGVDSTAAALLLKEKKLEVIGLFLDMTGEQQGGNAKGSKGSKGAGYPLCI